MGIRCVLLTGAIVLFAHVTVADEDAEVLRRVVASHGEAVVTVKMVLKETMRMGEFGTEESESTEEIIASVISPDGLMVTSLLELDPARMMSSLFPEEEEMGFETKTDVTSLRVLRGARETDAEIVLRDVDLDLAFLRPLKKPEAWAHIDLTSEVAAMAYEKVYSISRMGRAAHRLPVAYGHRILAVVERPRKTYINGEYMGDGSPVFVKSGACLGINVTRSLNLAQSHGMDFNTASIIVPGPDIMENVEQVPPYKSEE